MAKLKASRSKEIVLLMIACVTSSMLGFALRNDRTVAARTPKAAARQSDEKVIERKTIGDEPLELTDLAVKKTSLAPGRKFSASSLAEKTGGRAEDWLEDLGFTIKNKSDKQITYILIELQFPETEVNGPMMVKHVRIGIPPRASEDELRYYAPVGIEPGGKSSFTLSAKELKLMKEFLALRKFQLEELNKVVIRIAYVIFDDGIKWSQGAYYRPNPQVPGGYQRINQ